MLWISRLFSQRKSEAEGEPDVYQYDAIPEALRYQIFYCIQDSLAAFVTRDFDYLADPEPITREAITQLNSLLCKRYGRPWLVDDASLDSVQEVVVWLKTCTVKQVIDGVEAFLRLFRDCLTKFSQVQRLSSSQVEDNLNVLFAEHNVGYEFHNGLPQTVKSKFVHREVVKPTLGLLQEEGFGGAVSEFEKAHEHYRHKRYGEAITQANNAFESTMKCVLERIGHPFDEDNDPASKLIEHCIAAQVIPTSFSASCNSFAQMLKSSLPSIRSKMGAHGAGLEPKDVAKSYAELALHLAATYIVFLVERYREMT